MRAPACVRLGNTIDARSKLRRVKKAHGQILSCHELIEKNRRIVKNYGVWLRYESRTGTHNAYKEYREVALTDAIAALERLLGLIVPGRAGG